MRIRLGFAHKTGAAAVLAAMMLAGCASTQPLTEGISVASMPAAEKVKFEQDRKAILAMAGDYRVTFDFRETVSLTPGYKLKDPKFSGADEIVRLVEDKGDFISLQHILVMHMDDGKVIVTKHWRQDWKYEPADVLVFVGGNAWEKRAVGAKDRAGKWSQVVYQVEDSPRYGAVGAWTHDNGVSQWSPPAEMRPLPRRDMITRTDYDAVLAVNRHTITPIGWVQEEENSKLVLRGDHHVLVREIGVNTYKRNDFDTKPGDDYWAATKDYWALVRDEWNRLEATGRFGLTVQGEPEPLYNPMLRFAKEIEDGKTTTQAAYEKAKVVMAELTTQDIGTLQARIAKAMEKASASAGDPAK